MREQLKSCAHCGNNAELQDEDLNCYVWFHVQCNCGMRTGIYIDKNLAIQVWNTRAENKCKEEK